MKVNNTLGIMQAVGQALVTRSAQEKKDELFARKSLQKVVVLK